MKIQETDTLSQQAEAIRDRQAIKKVAKRVNDNRSTARAFLQRVGIITATGKLRKAYQ